MISDGLAYEWTCLRTPRYYLHPWSERRKPGTMDPNWVDIPTIPQASYSQECPLEKRRFPANFLTPGNLLVAFSTA